MDAVTSLGGHPLEMEAWGIDAAYTCTQKCVGAPSGLAPVAFAPSALARRVKCRSFYLDLGLLEDYWVRRKYHHTISASLVYALHEALLAIGEEGLEARWARHERHHRVLAAGLAAMGLGLLPPEGERLWTLNAVRVPDGVDELKVRKELLARFDMEVGAGLGPLAGKIWRVGLMGHSSSMQAILLFLSSMEAALRTQGHAVPPGAGTAAAIQASAAAGGVECPGEEARPDRGGVCGRRVRVPGVRLPHAARRVAARHGQPADDRVHRASRARGGGAPRRAAPRPAVGAVLAASRAR